MKKSIFKKKKRVPHFLVPQVKKRHAVEIYQAQSAWHLFAEGCLRNAFFHYQVFKRGNKCLACDRIFNHEGATTRSKIEKHHASYTRLCIGQKLPDNASDIYREATEKEFPYVPDCRRCKTQNPKYFEGCLKKIFPVHGGCHEDIHELEHWFIKKRRQKLMNNFKTVAKG